MQCWALSHLWASLHGVLGQECYGNISAPCPGKGRSNQTTVTTTWYKTLVCPCLEYCVQSSYPSQKRPYWGKKGWQWTSSMCKQFLCQEWVVSLGPLSVAKTNVSKHGRAAGWGLVSNTGARIHQVGLRGGGCKVEGGGGSLHKAGEHPAGGLGGNREKSLRGETNESVNAPNTSTASRSIDSSWLSVGTNWLEEVWDDYFWHLDVSSLQLNLQKWDPDPKMTDLYRWVRANSVAQCGNCKPRKGGFLSLRKYVINLRLKIKKFILFSQGGV